MEQLCFNTVRIETLDINKNSFSGTGFFFNLSIDGEQVPLLVTNKHVVEGMISGKFVLTEKMKKEILFINNIIQLKLEQALTNFG